MFRRIAVIALIVAGLAAGVTAAVGIAGGGGAEKFALLGPDAPLPFSNCDGGVTGGPSGGGFAVINAPGDGTVAATISLKVPAADRLVNSAYDVFLIQGSADCHESDAHIFLNGEGNATLHLSEPSVSTHAFVAVCKQNLVNVCDSGTSHLGGIWVTETYNH